MTFNGKQWTQVLRELREPFESHQLKKNNDGTQYPTPNAVRLRLDNVLGPNYSITEPKMIFQGCMPDKSGKNLCHVAVTLSIMITSDDGELIVERCGISAQTKEYYALSNMMSFASSLKGAKTSALRDAAAELGIGLYLYDDAYLPEEEEESDIVEDTKHVVAEAVSTAGIEAVKAKLAKIVESGEVEPTAVILKIGEFAKQYHTPVEITSPNEAFEFLASISKAHVKDFLEWADYLKYYTE